jgi:hypothetical protein
LITGLLALWKGLSGKRSLIDGNIDSFGETTIGGDNVTNLERNHIPGNEACAFDFAPSTVTFYFSLGGKRVHESFYGVSGIVFLVETNGRVDKQEQDNTDEIGPVRGAAFTV